MRIRRRAGSSGEVPASALSDMAFLLLVFFIIVSVFSPRIGVAVFLHPDAKKAAAALGKGEKIVVEGRGTDGIFYKNKKKTLAWVRDFFKAATAQDPRVAVRLALDPEFRYGLFVGLADAANGAGVTDFRTEGRRRGGAP